jgi:hypothetical protein
LNHDPNTQVGGDFSRFKAKPYARSAAIDMREN